MNIPDTPSLAERFAITLGLLCRAVAAQISGRRMTEALIVLVWKRVRRIDVRLQVLLQRFREGRLPVRAGVTRSGGGGGRRAGDGSVVLPRSFGWLLPLVPCEAAGYALQLRAVLGEPEMVAVLAASPQVRRLLAPLCRMLAIEAEVLRPGVAVASASGGVAVVKPKRVRAPGEALDLGRVPIPRGVMAWVRRDTGSKS